jgi:hypothetical protein
MKIAHAFAFAVVAVLGGAALAQDGAKPPVPPVPPVAPTAPSKVEKHVNKITDAAKDVFARFDKLLYSPVKLGLKDLAGTVKMEMDLPPEMESMRGQMPGMDLEFTVKFTAPDQVKVAAKEKESSGGAAAGMGGMMDQMKGQMTKGVASIVRFMVGVYRPADDSEFDADATTTDGKTTLTITSYEKNVEIGTMEMTLSPEGLPDVGVMTSKEKLEPPAVKPGMRERGAKGAAGDGKVTMHFVYGAEGSLRRLDKMTVEAPGAPAVIEQTLSYADADCGDAKIKICHRWTMSMGEMQKFGYRFTEMSINGKAVTLPKPEADAPPKDAK